MSDNANMPLDAFGPTRPPYAALVPGDLVMVRHDDGRVLEERVKTAPWRLYSGAWVVGLSGMAGGYDLGRVVAFLGTRGADMSDADFVKAAGEYESAMTLLGAERNELARVREREANREREARRIAALLKGGVGRNRPVRSTVVLGRLVRVAWAEGEPAVTLEDLTAGEG